jgi:hypothetical protein
VIDEIQVILTATVQVRWQKRRAKKSCLNYVNSMMDEFMVGCSKGPVQWMLGFADVWFEMHYNTTSGGQVEWCNGDELLYKKAQFNMAQFGGMIYGLMGQMRRIMLDESLFCSGARASDVPEIPGSRDRDDATNTTPGWSFKL